MKFKNYFFDIGANDGSDSIWVAEKDENIIVFAFEPTPKLYKELQEKTKHLKNYFVIPKAVSNYNGTSKFYVAGNADWGCSSLLEFSDKAKTHWPGRNDFVVTEEIEVDVIRLDTFIKKNNIPRINYIHIDTQGSDLNVLEGLGEKISIVYEGVMEAANKDNILYFGQNGKTESITFLQNKEFEVSNIKPNDSDFNEVNIFFKKKKKMKKIKQYIVTYNNEFQLNKCLNSLYDVLSQEELSMLEVNIINNHSNFHIDPTFLNKVKIFHNTLRPDFSTGHLSRNWNQSLLNGFRSILEPDCDIVITCQDDVEFSKNFINNLIEYHKSYDLIQVGKGDSLMSYTIDAIKKIGLWDERFCTIGFQEMDYYIRAVKYNFEKTSINDYFHEKVINPIDNLKLIKNTSSGFERKENHHTNSQIYFHVCSNLLSKKWSPFWEIIFYKPELRFDLEPQINSFVYYPYFERYVETLKEQKYLLQNDRIC